MTDIKPSVVLEDSKGNKYFFYYKDSSIYYREVPVAGDTKDTVLISQANADFTATIDSEDVVYLACNSRYKGVLLFTYTNMGWKFESVVNLNNSSNIYIMDMLVLNSSIHIFFAKKLPIPYMYNVYHVHKNLNDQIAYIEYSWKKNSISEIYSQSLENSYSILSTKGGIIHYASVWYDGTHYYINYYCFDDTIKSWLHKSLNISYNNQVSINLIYQNKKINLLCFSNENEASNIYHYVSKSSGSSEIDFKELNNLHIETGGIAPLFYSDDKAMQLAWLKDHIFHQYTFDDSAGKWRKIIDLPVTAETNISVFKLIRNSGSLSITKGYFLLDKYYKISRPIEHLSRGVIEDKSKDKPHTAVVPEMNDYLKQILEEIKGLSENVQKMNNRINSLESSDIVKKAPIEKSFEWSALKHEAGNSTSVNKTLKKSSFKEKFMKNEKLPNYNNLQIKQENITTFVGKPTSSNNSADAAKDIDINENPGEKRSYVSQGRSQNKSFLKKLGEFFK